MVEGLELTAKKEFLKTSFKCKKVILLNISTGLMGTKTCTGIVRGVTDNRPSGCERVKIE